MIHIKNREEIYALELGGKILANILDHIISLLKPNINTLKLEEIAENLIIEAGGRPSFKNYPLGGDIFFPSVLCCSVNDEVVHGSSLPSRILKSGDIVNVDIGMEWPVKESLREKYNLPFNKHSKLGGFYTDTCITSGVGKISKEASKLLRVTKNSLDETIKILKPGVSLNDIGTSIENIVKLENYGVVRDFVGHGLGYYAHEAPDIYNYSIGENSYNNLILKEGMVIAIEPMINLGKAEVKIADNNYTVLTKDKSLSAHFEHTIAILKDSYKVLTKK